MRVLCKALSATLRIESSAEISYISLLSIVIPTPTELMHGIFTVPTHIATQRGNQARTWNKYPSFIKSINYGLRTQVTRTMVTKMIFGLNVKFVKLNLRIF